MLVSDLGLPDGSGLELMRELRARRPVRGIALTGFGRREDVADTHAAGFDCHLTKPVELATLVATIESLRRTRARSTPRIRRPRARPLRRPTSISTKHGR